MALYYRVARYDRPRLNAGHLRDTKKKQVSIIVMDEGHLPAMLVADVTISIPRYSSSPSS